MNLMNVLLIPKEMREKKLSPERHNILKVLHFNASWVSMTCLTSNVYSYGYSGNASLLLMIFHMVTEDRFIYRMICKTSLIKTSKYNIQLLFSPVISFQIARADIEKHDKMHSDIGCVISILS